jgi:hypothetical protein
MTVQIELPDDVAARYSAQARVKGMLLESYVSEQLIEHAPVDASKTGSTDLELPLLRGEILSSLHRRDIYDDRP